MASISAWADGSRSSRGRLPAEATTRPSLTMAAPTGTSPRAAAARASSKATLMGSPLGLPSGSDLAGSGWSWSALSMSLASLAFLCYQALMTDSNDDNRKGRSSGRSDRGRTSGDRPFRKSREGGERPFRPKGEDDRPRKPRAPGDKPFRSRDNDERPRRPRLEGDKPFRARRE